MIIKDRSEMRAREILQHYVDSVSVDFSKYIEAMILVGSLSNGSYIEGPGRDIDVITILKDITNEHIKNLVLESIEDIEKKFNSDIPIARTIYRLSELRRPFKKDIRLCLENKHLIEVTTELQRIHESGILIYGRNIIDELPIPTREEVLYFDKLGKQWSKEELSKNVQVQRILDNPPINIIVQIIITNAFRHYYYSTNKSCSNKHEIANRMRQDVSNYKFQRSLDVATKYKMNPNIELQQKELEEMKKGYQELREWIENKVVDEVPLFF